MILYSIIFVGEVALTNLVCVVQISYPSKTLRVTERHFGRRMFTHQCDFLRLCVTSSLRWVARQLSTHLGVCSNKGTRGDSVQRRVQPTTEACGERASVENGHRQRPHTFECEFKLGQW